MKDIKPFDEITIWYRFNHKKEVFEHNHIEEGWSALEVPLPKSETQKKGWKGATWKKKFGFLQEGKVIEIGGEGILEAMRKLGTAIILLHLPQ